MFNVLITVSKYIMEKYSVKVIDTNKSLTLECNCISILNTYLLFS